MTDLEYLADDYDDEQDICCIPFGEEGLADISFDNVDSAIGDALVGRFKELRASQRRVAKFARQKAARREKLIEMARERLTLGDTWITSTHDRIRIKDMTPRHAQRSLNLIMNDFGRLVGSADISYADLGLSYPIVESPTVKALAKRAKAKETKRHRQLDEVSDTVFRAAKAGGRINIWETIQKFDQVSGNQF